LVEHWSPKPGVVSSSLATRANFQIMASIISYFKESIEELRTNVTLPERQDAQSKMVLVAVFTVLFSLSIWGIDTVLSRAFETFFSFIN
jgi:preprotein translocase subunit SecE